MVPEANRPDTPTMLHVSTRGEAPAIGFNDALLAGLARDGGLYMPERWPVLDQATIAGFAGRPYAEVAQTVLGALIGDEIEPAALRAMIEETYAGFRHPAVCPLTQLGDNLFVLELFHGPTLAFKDVAMGLLARLMDHALKAHGGWATIVGATSGDTGGAAIEAFRSNDRADVFILYPHGRVSEVQRRQMTAVDAPNVHALAVEGNFDDCQAIVKGLFNNHAFRDRLNLSGVNSINWARIAAQTVYYFTAAVALGAPHRRVSFAVPTGNFGDVLAGFVAKRMGLAVERLVVATNRNDILARALGSGLYEPREVAATISPSMDIQVSSNFERLLFEAHGRDGPAVRRLMERLGQSRAVALDGPALEAIRAEFDAGATDEAATNREMARTWAEAEYLLDPHTAVALAAARPALARDPATPMVVLGTAHPAKFPDAVQAATGSRPLLPPHAAHLATATERFALLPNDRRAVERFIEARARASREEAA